MITRHQYMEDSKALHVDYFLQFATSYMETILNQYDDLHNKTCKDFWDKLPILHNTALMVKLGDSHAKSLSNSVCTYKALAVKLGML